MTTTSEMFLLWIGTSSIGSLLCGASETKITCTGITLHVNLILIDMFRVSVKLQNTSGSLGEQELHWGRKPTPFLISPKLDKYFAILWGTRGDLSC